MTNLTVELTNDVKIPQSVTQRHETGQSIVKVLMVEKHGEQGDILFVERDAICACISFRLKRNSCCGNSGFSLWVYLCWQVGQNCGCIKHNER